MTVSIPCKRSSRETVSMTARLLACLLVAGCVAYPGSVYRTRSDPALEACRRDIFMQTDGNSDGVLDRTEAAADPLSWPDTFFERADKNDDGVVDRREYDELLLFVACEMCPKVADCAS